MPLAIISAHVNAVLLAHGGWQDITQGSLQVGPIHIEPAGEQIHGFTAQTSSGPITGRLSALLATRTRGTGTPPAE